MLKTLQKIGYLFLLMVIGLGSFLATPLGVLADHATPERVVDNKYVVIFFPSFDEKEAHLGFVFRDINTGKNIETPISFSISLKAEDDPSSFYTSPRLQTINGTGDLHYDFVEQGIYDVTMEFDVADQPGKQYRPSTWSLWVPGESTGLRDRYPIGLSELSGFGLFFLTIVAVGGNWLWLKHKTKKV